MNHKPWLAAQEEPGDDEEILTPQDTSLRWFGPHRAFRHSEATKIPAPIGEPCVACGKPLTKDDQGLSVPHLPNARMAPYHHECFIASILGPDFMDIVEEHHDGTLSITVTDD